MQGLPSLFSIEQGYDHFLDLIISQLPLEDRHRAASTCRAFAKAARDAVRCVQLTRGADVISAADAVAAGRYPHLIQLHLADFAAISEHLLALLALLSARLQLLHSTDFPSAAIPSLVPIASFSQLQSLSLDMPLVETHAEWTLLESALGQLTPLTQLTLTICSVRALRPLTSLSALSKLQQLSIGGFVYPNSLPPSITSLSLAGPAADDGIEAASSSCLQLQQLQLESAMLPQGSDWLWAKLQPLTVLTALEGSVAIRDLGELSWGTIGSEAAASWPVVQRLQRLCLGGMTCNPAFYDGLRVTGFIGSQGELSMLTKMTALWVEVGAGPDPPLGGPPKFPLNLRELRVSSTQWHLPLGTRTALTKLTWEMNPDDVESLCFDFNVACEVVQGLALLGGVDTELTKLKAMPQLRVLHVQACCLDAGVVGCLLHLAPGLEEVHFYRVLESDGAKEELALFHDMVKQQLRPRLQAPELHVSTVVARQYGVDMIPWLNQRAIQQSLLTCVLIWHV